MYTLLEYYNNIELNHAMKYIYKSAFNNHHCIYIEKKKCTQKQPSCEKMVRP